MGRTVQLQLMLVVCLFLVSGCSMTGALVGARIDEECRTLNPIKLENLADSLRVDDWVEVETIDGGNYYGNIIEIDSYTSITIGYRTGPFKFSLTDFGRTRVPIQLAWNELEEVKRSAVSLKWSHDFFQIGLVIDVAVLITLVVLVDRYR